jgi:alanyl-tRNA synthetase
MAADGVLPSNDGRGYILRRLLRRAIRHGLSLQKNEKQQSIVTILAQASIDAYSDAYSNLLEKQEHIISTLTREESRFMETLDTGMKLLNDYITELKSSGNKTLSGEATFKLYDTYGFPSELTREILEEQGFTWDEEGFQKEMENQKKRAREARGVSTYMGTDETIKLPPNLPTEFVGYDTLHCEAEILAIIYDDEVVEEIQLEPEKKYDVGLVLNKTPFYATSGGQASDTGCIDVSTLHSHVQDIFKTVGNNTVHLTEIQYSGVIEKLHVGMKVHASVDGNFRRFTSSNHTATHLLQAQLRHVLGSHVEQAGSEVTSYKLRFDFTHPTALTQDERKEVEEFVNIAIHDNLPVTVTTTTPEEARKMGALALFGEKYGDTVRVITIGDELVESVELCGGTHVNSTGEIKTFKILSETGISSGVRRIEAVTNIFAINFYEENLQILNEVAEICKTKPVTLPERIKTILEENKGMN